jgi:plasmid stability protein
MVRVSIAVIAKFANLSIFAKVKAFRYQALRMRAIRNGRSTEAEVCEILATAVKPENRFRMGDALAALGGDIGLTDAHPPCALSHFHWRLLAGISQD